MCHQASFHPKIARKYPLLALKLLKIRVVFKTGSVKKKEKKTLWYNSWHELHKRWLSLTAYRWLSSIGRCLFCTIDISSSHNIHIFYPPFKLFPHLKYRRFIVKTWKYLFVLQFRPTGNTYFRFQKRWGTDKHEKGRHKFDHFSLKSSRGTEGVAENTTVCNSCQFHDPWITL